MDISLIDKLNNMYESEISDAVFTYIENNQGVFKSIENEVMSLLPEYDFKDEDELYDCDEIYMRAIINVMPDLVTHTKCGYGRIKLLSE